MSSQPKSYITVQQYLEQEEAALDRHEYFNGEVFAMAGGTPEHSLIASNLMVEIGWQLRKTGCRVRGSDMRIQTEPNGLFSYADAVISCQPELFNKTTLVNPVVIIEVLSESTEGYDRGKKFEQYRKIRSFREYLIVAQDRIYVEHHIRSGALEEPAWTMRQFTLSSDVISFEAVEVRLPLAAIYADVTV